MDDNPNYYREDAAWTTPSGRASYCVMTPLRLAVMCTPKNDGNRPFRSDIGYLVRDNPSSPWRMETADDGKVGAFVANAFHKSDVAEGVRVPAHGFMLDSLELAIVRAAEPDSARLIIEVGRLRMVASAQYDARLQTDGAVAARQILDRRRRHLESFVSRFGNDLTAGAPSGSLFVGQIVVDTNIFLVRIGQDPLLTITNLAGMTVGAEGELPIKNLSVTWNGDALLGLPRNRPRLQVLVTTVATQAQERFASELQAAAGTYIKSETADIQMVEEFIRQHELRVAADLNKIKTEAEAFDDDAPAFKP